MLQTMRADGPRKEGSMFDRVAVAFALVMLMLFGAEIALSCIECDHGTARCLVPLELQAEEAIDADLEVAPQTAVFKDAYDGEHANDFGTVGDVAYVRDRHPETKAVGSAGVYHSVVINENDGVIGGQLRSGRFAGDHA